MLAFTLTSIICSPILFLRKRPGSRDYRFRMPPRLALSRIWTACRTLQSLMMVNEIVKISLEYANVGGAFDAGPDTPVPRFLLIGGLFLGSVCTPFHVRNGFLDFLGNLAESRHAQQEVKRAAAISSLVGSMKTKDALALGKRSFYALHMSQLCESDFTDNKDTGLFQKTKNIKLGECDAFISHSWSDDGKEKWARLVEFNEEVKEREDREALVWLDKACINQSDIDASLVKPAPATSRIRLCSRMPPPPAAVCMPPMRRAWRPLVVMLRLLIAPR